MWESIIILLVVALAAWFLGRRYYKAASGKQSACGCGCSCGSGDQTCEEPGEHVSTIQYAATTPQGKKGR